MSYARRVKALYPPEGMAVGADTPLDRGLQAGIETWNETLKAPVFATPSRPVSEQQHRAQRRMIWRNATEQQRRAHVRVLWRNATSANNADVQRALLLLEAHKDPGFRLMEAGKVENAAVAKVMKEIPYLSPKRGLPRNYNCQVRFVASGAESTSRESPSTGRPIACRHFVEHLQARQEQTEHGKFDYAEFANPEAIAENVTIGTDAGVKSFVSTAAETHMFRNRDFGQMLIEQFTKMKAQGQAHRLMALVSTRHMMSLRLRIKLKDGKERFVVTFFDPQITTSHVRAASNELVSFETLELKSFIAEQATYERYYSENLGRDPKTDGLTTMFVRPMPRAAENRTLTSCIGDKDVDATALWHMLACGFAGDMRRLKYDLASRPQEELVAVLANKDARGTPGLCPALQAGRADAVRAYSELLGLVKDPEVRADLVDVPNFRGDSGLCLALQEGRADAVEAFGEILKLLPEGRRAKLVAAKSAHGVPGYVLAVFAGRPEAIRALGGLLAFVPPHGIDELRAEYESLRDDPGHDLQLALREAPTAVRDAFRELGIGLGAGRPARNFDTKSRRLS